MKRYENFANGLAALSKAPGQDFDNEFILSGVIDKFSLQFELSWKLMKALLAYEGDDVARTGSPREVVKAAYQHYDWMTEDLWLQMLRDRNNTAHVYDVDAAKRLVTSVLDSYIPEFERFKRGLIERYGEDFLLG